MRADPLDIAESDDTLLTGERDLVEEASVNILRQVDVVEVEG